jgi:hypothetical protein
VRTSQIKKEKKRWTITKEMGASLEGTNGIRARKFISTYN